MPLGALAGTLLAGGVTAGVDWLTQRGKEKRAEKRNDFEYERSLEDQRANWDRDRNAAIDSWNMQNEYNSFSNVRKRMEEAGMNPYMMYGSGTGFQSAPLDVPSSSSPVQGSRVDYEQRARVSGPDMVQSYIAQEQLRMQRQMNEMNQELVKAQTLKVLTDVDKKKLDTDLLRQTFTEQVLAASLGNVETHEDILVKRQQQRESEQRMTESAARIAKIFADTDFTINENQRREIMVAAQTGQITEQTKLIVQQVLESQQRVLESQARTAKTQAEKDRIQKQSEMLQNELDYWTVQKVQDWIPFLKKTK